MSLPAAVVKRRILTAFRKQTYMVREDGTIDWSDLCLVLKKLDPQFCTEERLQDLRISSSASAASGFPPTHPAEGTNVRIKLEAFLDWIFVDTDVSKVNIQAGNLAYPVTEQCLTVANRLVQQVTSCTETDPVQRAQKVLRSYWQHSRSPQWPKRGESGDAERHLLFIYTDLEPDDIMAIAQLWEWKNENCVLDGEPLVAFMANFEAKDGGSILEKKQLLVQLLLGLSKYYTLTKEGDIGTDVYKLDKTTHPQYAELLRARDRYLDELCEELLNFGGRVIDFYVISPGRGNLGAIVKRLKEKGPWPTRARWRVSMYSGSNNMRGMTPEDLEALREIMNTCADKPLVDVGKFPFFGGKDCHPWTDSLTTFAMPNFAKELATTHPVHASMLKLFNDEFNATLVDPDSKSLFKKGIEWTAEEQARFEQIKSLYNHADAQKLQEYASRMLEDPCISQKMADYKKSTFKAFACGGCDSPLCDQLLFLYEWACKERSHYLEIEEGYWHFNAEKGFTEIKSTSDGSPDTFRAIRPKIAHPNQEEELVELRHALHNYLMKHLFALDCHIAKVSGMLVYTGTKESEALLNQMINEVRNQGPGDNPNNVIRHRVNGWHPATETSRGDTLLFVYTDLEPDDVMAIAELWEWKDKLAGEPLVVFAADFAGKDGGRVLEKKRLMSGLMLGLSRSYTLAPEADKDGRMVFENDGTVHPHNEWIVKRRRDELDAICEELINFKGTLIDFFVLAPGHGNLSAIVSRLMDKGKWPLQAKWRISLYSGQFNMKGMSQGDILALTEMMRHSEEPLTDVGKFPFFGGKNAHPWTDSLTTFASPNLANTLSNSFPMVAAILKAYNDEFNAGLVNPHTKDFFKKNPLTDEERHRYEGYKAGFVYTDADSIQRFCKQVAEDVDIFAKMPGFKKSTFRAFAYGGADSPLCDQLLFASEYLQEKKPDSLTWEEGLWFFDSSGGGFTEIRQDAGRFRARRPALKDAMDEVVLAELRGALERFLVEHLDQIFTRVEPFLRESPAPSAGPSPRT